MPRPTLLLLPLLTLGAAYPATTQATTPAPILTGRVLDAKTRLPVPYASLSMRHESNGTLANTKGHFELAAPQKAGTDTLLVQALNYLPHKIALRNQVFSDTTLLLDKVEPEMKGEVLRGVRIVPLQLGSHAKQPGEGLIWGLTGSQYALLMQPSLKLELGAIRTVSFFIGESGFPNEPFRIRIYRADGPNHSPGTNLLTESIVVKAPVGGQWFTVDISKYVVEVPREGFFAAMEWLIGAGTTYPGLLYTDSFTFQGQVMRPTFEFKDNRTWNFTIGKGWSLLTFKNSNSRAYNAMIRAEIDELK